MRVEFSRVASADLESIGDRIATRSPKRALAYVAEIRARCMRIADFPRTGTQRPEWGEGIRIDIHGPYLIFYRVLENAVQILRIVHGARDLNKLFEDEPLE